MMGLRRACQAQPISAGLILAILLNLTKDVGIPVPTRARFFSVNWFGLVSKVGKYRGRLLSPKLSQTHPMILS